MDAKIYRVMRQGKAYPVKSAKGTAPQYQCNIRLQEMGETEAERCFTATLTGNNALCRYRELDLVAACLRFYTQTFDDHEYQKIYVTDIVKLTPNPFGAA